MVDFRLCRWPDAVKGMRDTSVAEYFDNLNEPELSQLADSRDANGALEPLITFSHFLPLQVHLPVADLIIILLILIVIVMMMMMLD
jgi:hypothetical protein